MKSGDHWKSSSHESWSVSILHDRTSTKEPRAITYCERTANYTRASANSTSSPLLPPPALTLVLSSSLTSSSLSSSLVKYATPTAIHSRIGALQSCIYTNHYRIKLANTGRRISHLERKTRGDAT